MRHRRKINHLSRTSAHRKAMLANMASSLIIHKRIETTVAKARALRMFIEPLITHSKNDTTHSRRIVFSQLQNKEAVTELFREVATKVAERPGGYTRILKLRNRPGDNADMCLIELVDFNVALVAAPEETKTKTTRRRRSPKKKTEPGTEQPPVKEEVKESATEPEKAPSGEKSKEKTKGRKSGTEPGKKPGKK